MDRISLRMHCLDVACRAAATPDGVLRAAKLYEEYILGEQTAMAKLVEQAKGMGPLPTMDEIRPPQTADASRQTFRPYSTCNVEELP
jgi:hypothetical protein